MNIPYIINLTELAKESKITYTRLYFRKNGVTKSELDNNDRTRIVNAIVNKLKPFFKELGFDLILKQMG